MVYYSKTDTSEAIDVNKKEKHLHNLWFVISVIL